MVTGSIAKSVSIAEGCKPMCVYTVKIIDRYIFDIIKVLIDTICLIIRTAEISGVDGIIIQNNSSAPINSDTIKTSAGAIFNIPICKVNHIKDAIYHLKSIDISIVSASEKANKNVYDVDFTKPVAVIMGSEQRGINKSIINLSDEVVKLPMYGKIQSLNVSVACGVFLYEVVRQRI